MSEPDNTIHAGRPGAGILRNAAWMVWSGGVSIANGVVLWAALARWRQPEEVGQFTAVIGLQTIFATICALGIGPYLTSEIARRRDRGRFVTGAVALIGCWSWAASVT